MKKVIDHGEYFRLTCKTCGCVFEIDNPEKELGSINVIVLTDAVIISQGIACPECQSIRNIRNQSLMLSLDAAIEGKRSYKELIYRGTK